MHFVKEIFGREMESFISGGLWRFLTRQHSIRINDQYRIIFKWDSDRRGALEVKITDYH